MAPACTEIGRVPWSTVKLVDRLMRQRFIQFRETAGHFGDAEFRVEAFEVIVSPAAVDVFQRCNQQRKPK